MLKKVSLIPAVLVLGILISIGFTYFYFMNALYYNVKIDQKEKIIESDYRFVLIVQEMDNPYFSDLLKGALAIARKSNVSLEYIGTQQTDINEHIKLIEKAIASKVDGILTQGLSNTEFEPVIQKALDKGIPVITVDTDLEHSNRNSYVGTDNYQAGYIAGLTVVNETEKLSYVGIITGSFQSNQHEMRVDGFLDAVESNPKIKVLAIESSNLTSIQGAEKTYQMLREYPTINVLYGTSARDGIGIVSALDMIKPQSPIRVYTFDDLEETVNLMKKDRIHAIFQQQPYDMGSKSVSLLLDLMKGKEIQTTYYTDIHVLRKKDVKDQ